MGIFRKKDGSPSLFGKIVGTVTKVASVASTFIPGVGGLVGKGIGAVSNLINKGTSKVAEATGGAVDLSNLQLKPSDVSVESYVDRIGPQVARGVGGAAIGFANGVNMDAQSGGSFVADAKQGAISEKLQSYLLPALLVVGGIVVLKKLKVF